MSGYALIGVAWIGWAVGSELVRPDAGPLGAIIAVVIAAIVAREPAGAATPPEPAVAPADDEPVVRLIPLHAAGGRHRLHPEQCRPHMCWGYEPPAEPREPYFGVEPWWKLPLLPRHRRADIPFRDAEAPMTDYRSASYARYMASVHASQAEREAREAGRPPEAPVWKVYPLDPPPGWVEIVPRSACWDEYTYLMLNGLARITR